MPPSWGDWHGHSGSQRGQGSWWNKGDWSSSWSERDGWRTDQWEDAAGDVQWKQDKANDVASKEVDAELEACKDENERHQLLMRREVQKNREKMAAKEQQRQQEEAAKAAKAKKLQDDKDQKIREYREGQDKQFIAAMEAQERQQLQEAERQRKLAEATARGRAAKRGADAGRLKREQKQAELERQAAEVLANIAASTTSTTKKSGSAEVAPTDEEKTKKVAVTAAEKVEAVEYPIRARPKRRPIGPSMRAAPEEAPEEELAPELAPEPASASSSSSSKAAVTLKKKKKAMWWHKIDGECPISLSAICELPQPPFALESCGAAEPHYFDARFLANYLVSSCDFIDPNNRRPLTREECVALDEHLRWYYSDQQFIIVADAFDLFERNVAGEAGTSVQREATSVLQHLFRFSSLRRTDARGRAVNFQQGALTVVDDDDVLAPDASAPSRSRSPPSDDAEAFPSLPSDAPAPKAKAKSKAYHGASRGPPTDGASFPTLLGAEPALRGAWQKRQATVAPGRNAAARRPVTAEQRAAESAAKIAAARADFERRCVDHWEDWA